MKKLTNLQKIQKIRSICGTAGVCCYFDSDSTESKYRKYIAVLYIGTVPFYYTLDALLGVRPRPEQYAHVSQVVISTILI